MAGSHMVPSMNTKTAFPVRHSFPVCLFGGGVIAQGLFSLLKKYGDPKNPLPVYAMIFIMTNMIRLCPLSQKGS